uniref:TRP_2 domain-containing protein n=1 Tax=Rhabditophanes sp. KR3021 TaxID=114890 RepID=A0AC35TTM9_9BILA
MIYAGSRVSRIVRSNADTNKNVEIQVDKEVSQARIKRRRGILAADFEHNSQTISQFTEIIKMYLNEKDLLLEKLLTVFYHKSNNQKSMVECLKEAILITIQHNNLQLTKALLSILGMRYPNENLNFTCFDSQLFPGYITPIHQACLVNNYHLVEFFLKIGHSLALCHRLDCQCGDCHGHIVDLDLRQRKLDYYKAYASEAFLWYATNDPLLSALKVSKELEEAVTLDSNNSETYKVLSISVKKFAKKIYSSTKSTFEASTLLETVNGATISEFDETMFPILSTYFKANAKEVLMDPNIINVLETTFITTTVDYKLFTIAPKTIMIVNNIFYFLMICLFYAYRFATYNEDKFMRGTNSTLVNSTLAIMFMYGYAKSLRIWQKCWRTGVKIALSRWWVWFDAIIALCYILAAYHYVANFFEIKYDSITQLNRRHWDPIGAKILFELYFAVGSIILSWRLFYLLTRFKFIGIMVVVLAKCSKVIVQYGIIAAIIIISFNAGITLIFHPYVNNRSYKNGDSADGDIIQFPHYDNMWNSQKMMYWAFYGYLAPWEMSIVVGEAGYSNSEPPTVTHWLTQNVGEMTFALYYGVLILALLNLIISMLVKTAETAINEADIEYNYDEVRIKFDSFSKMYMVPTPFNALSQAVFGIHWLVHACIANDKFESFKNGFFKRSLLKYKHQLIRRKADDHEIPKNIKLAKDIPDNVLNEIVRKKTVKECQDSTREIILYLKAKFMKAMDRDNSAFPYISSSLLEKDFPDEDTNNYEMYPFVAQFIKYKVT